MVIEQKHWDQLYALKEKYAYIMDHTLEDMEYVAAHAAFKAIVEVLTILGE